MIPRPIYYKNKTDFLNSNSDYLESTCQYYDDIVYIEDTEEIYTHGKIFGDKGIQLNLYDLLTGDTATKQAYYQKLKDQYDKDPNNPVIAYLYVNDGEKDIRLYKRPLLFQYVSRIDSFSAPIWQVSTDSDDFEASYITISSTGEFAQGTRTIVTKDMLHSGTAPGTIGVGVTNIPVNGLGSAAFMDVNSLIQPMVDITYAELYTLVSTGSLTPGQKYRIIDYETIIEYDDVISAGHVFDLVVTALSSSELSHDANALQSARDSDNYFGECNLSAWKIRYDINNDSSKYAWAAPAQFNYDSSNCIVKSELVSGNSFINPISIVYSEYYDAPGSNDYQNDLANTLLYEYAYDDTTNELCIYPDNTGYEVIEKYLYRGIRYVNNVAYDYWQKMEDAYLKTIYIYTPRIVDGDVIISSSGGKGVIYHMVDEWNNECPYDFKNIMFERWQKSSNYGVSWYIGDSGSGVWVYTFTKYDLTSSSAEDGSLCIVKDGMLVGCYNNKIARMTDESYDYLSNNVMIVHSDVQYDGFCKDVYIKDSSRNTIIECANISLDNAWDNILEACENIFALQSSENTLWQCHSVDMTRANDVIMFYGSLITFFSVDSITFTNYNDIVQGDFTSKVYNYLVRNVRNVEILKDSGEYLKTVALNSKGEVKTYCEADLIA